MGKKRVGNSFPLILNLFFYNANCQNIFTKNLKPINVIKTKKTNSMQEKQPQDIEPVTTKVKARSPDGRPIPRKIEPFFHKSQPTHIVQREIWDHPIFVLPSMIEVILLHQPLHQFDPFGPRMNHLYLLGRKDVIFLLLPRFRARFGVAQLPRFRDGSLVLALLLSP